MPRKFKLKYEYESLKDHVLPNEAAAFFASYKKVDDGLEYELSKETEEAEINRLTDNNGRGSVNLVYVFCLVGILFGGGIWWTQRKSRG